MAFKSLPILAVTVLALAAGAAQAQNRLFNGGFEIGQTTVPGANGPVPLVDPTNAQGWLDAAQGYSRSSDARTGSFSARVNQTSPDNAGVMLQNSKQSGGLGNLVPGQVLTLSFWAKADVPDSLSFYNMSYSLRYLNDIGNILFNTGSVNFQNQINSSTWTLITGSPITVPMGATAAFLEFSAAGGGRLAAFKIDDVSLVPEPGTYALMLLGLAGMGAFASRRRAAAA